MIRLLGTLRPGLASLLVIACASSDVAGPGPNAALVQTCAPWDGAAVALFLTDQPSVPTYPTAPYTEITVYHGVSQITGRRFDVGPDTPSTGFAQECPQTGACAPARTASVAFGELNADSTIAVSYRLESASGRVLRGEVRPRLSPMAALCG